MYYFVYPRLFLTNTLFSPFPSYRILGVEDVCVDLGLSRGTRHPGGAPSFVAARTHVISFAQATLVW